MIEGLSSAEKYLYHYTSAEVAFQYILPDRVLKLGRYKNTNDPKEAKSWSFDFGTNEDRDLGKYDQEAMSIWLNERLKSGVRILCCSCDTPPLTGSHIKDIFNRGFCKPRMWAQYGGDHSGVCLVFDKGRLSQNMRDQLSETRTVVEGPIEYRDRDIVRDLWNPDDQQYTINIDHLETVGSDRYPGDHFYTHYKRLFFEKIRDWRTESEWRFMTFSEMDDEVFLQVDECLAGVIFGDSVTDTTIDEAMRITSDLSFHFMGLRWTNCSPWYDHQNLKYVFGLNSND